MGTHMGAYGEHTDSSELLAGCNRRFEVRRAANGWVVTVFYEAKPPTPAQMGELGEFYGAQSEAADSAKIAAEILAGQEVARGIMQTKEFEDEEDPVARAKQVADKLVAMKKAASPTPEQRLVAYPAFGGHFPPESFLFTERDDLLAFLEELLVKDGQR